MCQVACPIEAAGALSSGAGNLQLFSYEAEVARIPILTRSWQIVLRAFSAGTESDTGLVPATATKTQPYPDLRVAIRVY
jgi:hypothetical protein